MIKTKLNPTGLGIINWPVNIIEKLVNGGLLNNRA